MLSLIDQWVDRLLSNNEKKTEPDPGLDQTLQTLRAYKRKLTKDQAGMDFVSSPAFLEVIEQLDAEGLTGLADELCADALLVHPNHSNKNIFGHRLLSRGREKEAENLFLQLTNDMTFAHGAFKNLAHIAETSNAPHEACLYLEKALAWDFHDQELQASLKRLRKSLRPTKNRKSDYFLTSLVRGARIVGEGYELRKLLGRGGAATVYQALVSGTQQEVAVKVFHRSSGSTRHQEKAQREAQFTAQLTHPHVVTILDVNSEKGFLVMAFCEGGSLRDRLKQKKASLAQTLDMAIVLLRTLADIHEHGFSHLDIKPSNILFHHGTPIFSDFGIAVTQEEGQQAGTQAYMAPEQKRGQANRASDVFAMGLVITECLLGHPTRHIGQNIQLPPVPKGPKRRALEHLLRGMCDPEPTHRPQDLRELAQRFMWAQALPDSEAQGTVLLEQMRKWALGMGTTTAKLLEKHPIVAYLSPVDLKHRGGSPQSEI